MKKILSNVKRDLSKVNFPLLLLMIVYSIFGLIMIFSASSVTAVQRYGYSSNHFFIKQLISLVLAYVAGFFVLLIQTKWYKVPSYIAIFGIIAFLSVVLVAGAIAGGARSWFEVGIFNFQPTEYAKVILIMFMAVYYHGVSQKKRINFIKLVIPVIVAGILFLLIAVQPDLGGALIIGIITALIFFSIPFGKRIKSNIIKTVLIGGGGLLGIALILGVTVVQPYQIKRIFEFAKPCERYTDESGYQVCNGYIAIHNGGLGGVGLGESTQKYSYLPEAHTDFIFPIICEELGAVIGIIVVIGYGFILYQILKIAKSTYNLKNSILCYGIFTYVATHILVNLLGVLGLMPLTGVPLPFLSYGGSYNICLIISLFIVHRVNIENKLEKNKQLIKNL